MNNSVYKTFDVYRCAWRAITVKDIRRWITVACHMHAWQLDTLRLLAGIRNSIIIWNYTIYSCWFLSMLYCFISGFFFVILAIHGKFSQRSCVLKSSAVVDENQLFNCQEELLTWAIVESNSNRKPRDSLGEKMIWRNETQRKTETIFYHQEYRQSRQSRRTIANGLYIYMGASGRKREMEKSKWPCKCSLSHALCRKTMGNWRQFYLFHVYPHAMMTRISRCLQPYGLVLVLE